MASVFAGHLEERPFESPSQERDLSLELWIPGILEFMQQVEGDIRLRNESSEAVEVDPNLAVGGGAVDLLVRRPADRFPKVYRPFGRVCVKADKQELASGASLYQEIAPSFGLRHWFFDEPGTYEVQATVRLADGRRLFSPVRPVRILRPDRGDGPGRPRLFRQRGRHVFGGGRFSHRPDETSA